MRTSRLGIQGRRAEPVHVVLPSGDLPTRLSQVATSFGALFDEGRCNSARICSASRQFCWGWITSTPVPNTAKVSPLAQIAPRRLARSTPRAITNKDQSWRSHFASQPLGHTRTIRRGMTGCPPWRRGLDQHLGIAAGAKDGCRIIDFFDFFQARRVREVVHQDNPLLPEFGIRRAEDSFGGTEGFEPFARFCGAEAGRKRNGQPLRWSATPKVVSRRRHGDVGQKELRADCDYRQSCVKVRSHSGLLILWQE
jgi:hypothetical protein